MHKMRIQGNELSMRKRWNKSLSHLWGWGYSIQIMRGFEKPRLGEGGLRLGYTVDRLYLFFSFSFSSCGFCSHRRHGYRVEGVEGGEKEGQCRLTWLSRQDAVGVGISEIMRSP